MSTLAARALDTNAANFGLGNEVLDVLGARLVRNRETHDIYDANHASDVTAKTPSEIDALIARLDVEYQHSNHRRFDVDFRTPPEFLARLLLDGGYERTDALCLVLEGELVGKPTPCDIRPVVSDEDWEAYWELMIVNWRDNPNRGEAEHWDAVGRRMFASHRLKQGPVQYFLAYLEDQPAGFFNAWEGVDGMGQVEDLFVLPEYRKRGIATALIHHCVAESRRRGAKEVLIVADPDDTPKNIYARMGFRPVAVHGHYLKKLSKEG